VAPDPDIRASQAPLVALSAAMTLPITGWTRMAGLSRSLELAASASTHSSSDPCSSGHRSCSSTSVTPTSNSPLRRPSAAKTSLVATGTPGLTITQGIFGRLSGCSVSPTPVMTQPRDWTQTGTSAPVNFATSTMRGSSSESPFNCASSRRAAAASAEPPPMPAATGNTLSSEKLPVFMPGTRSANRRAALSTRLSDVSPHACASGPDIVKFRSEPGDSVSWSAQSANATTLSRS
jgi:hypothetical protein